MIFRFARVAAELFRREISQRLSSILSTAQLLFFESVTLTLRLTLLFFWWFPKHKGTISTSSCM